jgi:Arc/MetJ-type ribon-helix-helix transcriptional regulator
MKAIPKTRGGRRPGSGRKPTGVDPARTIRLSDEFIATVDTWAAQQDDSPNRSEAIRRLVELGLAVRTRLAPSERQRAALADLASKAIDSLKVEAPDDEKASRKRRLIKGPEEFREDRVDLPKAKGK